jgi:DNA-binding CsgD family transcriptional regulator
MTKGGSRPALRLGAGLPAAAESVSRWPEMSNADAGFVGRSAELEAMDDLLERAGRGAGRVALLGGEPGVGKTRLAREFAARAAGRGSLVLWGAAYEGSTPPYGPWTQALRSYVEQQPRDLRAEAPVLAAVVPELRERYPDAAPAPSLGTREEQLRLHDTVATVLADSDRTVLVVLDDLHWADRATLELMLAVARSPAGVLVVATMRDAEPSDALVSCLADLTRERLSRPLDIGRLTEDESVALIEHLVGGRVAASVVAAIYEQAQGNPFFTEELARHASASGGEELSIPDSVRLAVAAHVRRLSQDAARVVGVAAVFTRPFEFRALQLVAELPEDTVLDALDEALAAGLLIVARAEAESYEFGHDLVRQSLYEEFNPSRRARLHRRAAHALEELADGSEPEAAAELAAQYHRSASLPGAAHGVGYALAAADAAEARHAPAEAARLLRIAHDLAGALGAAERAGMLCRVALAEADSLELEAARRTAEAAVRELAEAEATGAETAGFLWELARKLRDLGARDDEVRPLVERGLSLVGDEHGLEWARLKLVLRPAEPLESGRIVAERWLGYDPEAVRIARASGDELDYAATFELMDWRDRAEIAELLERCRDWREPAARIHALSIAARTLLYNLGAFGDAEAVSRELLAESELAGSLTGTAYALEQIADVQIALGEFEGARASLARARATAAKLGPAHRVHFIVDFVATRLATYVDGDLAARAREYERAATDPGTAWPWITIQAAGYAAFAYARADARADATRLLDELIPLLETLTPTTLNQNGAVGLAGAAVWELRDSAWAEPCRRLALELLDAEVGDDVSASQELTVARMASLLGDHGDADEWFERAAAKLRADGRRPLYVVAVLDRAAAAVAARAAVPITELREAHDVAVRLGMPATTQRAAALLDDVEATPPAGLTPREAEILRLVAGGRTNREIADTLVLSVHTIERHLANAYRKIGARNRADATAFTLREL